MRLRNFLGTFGLPGIISVLSLLAAWLAITLLINETYSLSVLFAVIAFILDSLDGYVARKTGKVSDLGAQLDNLIDLINYSLYSALIVYLVLIPGPAGIVLGFFILLAGTLRLVKFSREGFIQNKNTLYYQGLVVCHVSLATISLWLISMHINIAPIVIAMILVIVSILQLSNIKVRKSGLLPLWYFVALALAVGGLLWL